MDLVVLYVNAFRKWFIIFNDGIDIIIINKVVCIVIYFLFYFIYDFFVWFVVVMIVERFIVIYFSFKAV